ncbi:MAG: putative rRNA maturation factor [Parcubacteria group bacterium GW2011_GWA2_43_9b]|uniref:Endoribonuclease YbeY n=1 Tax=Candidatus Portnoybacteria bacterium RIFCSPLOWO2_02_FULL_39_11 TaxID=1802001 RepID=A0A1G2FWN2_9BACT|nr:MAG: putative rRNA maturation factor [Parcubacteria group bacterium GW2011_GWA2_43_9b]OGZ42018.1 MAG: rRNA maturation RNase YbeY [Candidatus Portnoybacteria bacterium RIFCSPLOWO2_02_FULL_39_11]
MLEVFNRTKIKIDTKFLQKVAQAALAVLRAKKEISLVFIGDAKMKELNKKYRGKNKTTDVLSFKELNEIFICLPFAKKQAKMLKDSLKAELTRLLTHGIVHLKGYNHAKSAQEAERMFKVEEKILNSLQI